MNKIGVGFGVMIINEGKILLGKRSSDPEKADSELHGFGCWTMPGGKLEYGESFEEGAKREVYEETGLTIGKFEVICVNNDMNEFAHFVTIGMLCKDFKGSVETKEPDEITEWKWFDIDKLPEQLYFPTKKIIRNFKDKKFYLSI